jgi:hypothetical protein
MKTAVIHTIWSMGIDNTHQASMKTALIYTSWSREQISPMSHWKLQWYTLFEVRKRQHPGPNENCSDTQHLKKAIYHTQVPMKTAVIHTIWSMGIDNTQVPMKTAVTHTIWIREQTTPWFQWTLQWYTPFEVGKRQHPGPNENCSDAHHWLGIYNSLQSL